MKLFSRCWKLQDIKGDACVNILWRKKDNFPFILWVFSRDPCNRRKINKRKANRNLLTHVPPVYTGDTQGKMSQFLSGLEFRFKYHDNRKEERGWGLLGRVMVFREEWPLDKQMEVWQFVTKLIWVWCWLSSLLSYVRVHLPW